MSKTLVAEKPDVKEHWLAVVSEAVRAKDWVAAIAAAERLLAAAPGDAVCQIAALQAFLQSGEVARAARLATGARPNWPGNAKLAHLSMLAFGRVRDRNAAAEAARIAIRADSADLRIVAAAGDALTQIGRASEAVRALEGAIAPATADARAWYELGRARHRLGEDLPAALVATRRSLELDPASVRAAELVARIQLELGMPHQALAVLDAIPEDRWTSTVLMTMVEACAACGHADRAGRFAKTLSDARPDSFALTRRLTTVLGRMGQIDLSRDIYAANLDLRRAALPQDFITGVGPLLSSEGRRGDTAPQERLDWLWGQLAAAGRAPADRDLWEAEVATVARLDRYILDWIECRPDGLDQIGAIMAPTDPARDEVAAALGMGKGAFLAAAHVGLLFGSIAALALSGLPMAFVSSSPNLGTRAYDGHLISTTTHDDAAIGRAMYRAVRSGKAVSVAIEGSKAVAKERHPFFDGYIHLSTFIPGLAWKIGTPSYFPFMAWTGGRAEISVRRLPDAQDFPTLDAYRAAWTKAYLAALETALLTHPGSARVSGGFWANIVL